ncbi:efflux RND transporter permease subunit, partial [Pseudophaeobacter arcticus]|uniref:efflux RND transporter permease subunit n=1 Tax=Pseudophaeobacter arcticus TaxID=385492 RepID=UPI002492DB99
MTFRSIVFAASSTLALMAGTAFAKDSVTIGLQLEPPHLDPTSAAAGAIDQVLYSNVFEGLTRFMGDGSVVPGLAESWEISADGLSYTFHLNAGVTFHDGTTMDAEDVKFSLDRARAEDSTNAQKALFADIASVDVLDAMTVKVTLSKQNGSFLFNMAWGDAVIVATESIADIKTKPVGTGPFMLSNWVQGDRIELAKNPNYWGQAIALEKATFKFISDPTAAFAAVMAEDVNAFMAFPAPENLPQFDADPRFKVLVGSTEGETILSTNNKMPPFDNVKVRQAVAHAIDRQAIIDGAKSRFRPIMLTSLTTFLGVAPITFETSLQAQFLIPMSASLGFGVLFGAVILQLLIPALAVLEYRGKRRLQRKWRAWSARARTA